MTCVSPPELDEVELIAHLSGEADEGVVNHLARCQHCRSRAERLESLQAILSVRLGRIDCPSAQDLGEFHLGLPNEIDPISTHVQSCPHCQQEIDQLRGFLAAEVPGETPKAEGRVLVLIARMLEMGVDLAAEPLAVGSRGGQERAVIYHANGIQIAISTDRDSKDPALKAIFGLVSGDADRPRSAVLRKGTSPIAESAIDDRGNFVFHALEPAEYELTLAGEDIEISIDQIVVPS